jgi:uncharacterized membrane protein YbaN (DUF454 family)
MKESCQEVPVQLTKCWMRWVLIGFGWLNVAVGTVGIFVPGLPTTVFLIIAFWAFSKSSERFQMWAWNHPRFGPTIRAWHEHKVIPVRAKVMAASMMTVSFLIVTVFIAESWMLPAIMASMMVPAAAYVLSRASHVPVPVRVTARR